MPGPPARKVGQDIEIVSDLVAGCWCILAAGRGGLQLLLAPRKTNIASNVAMHTRSPRWVIWRPPGAPVNGPLYPEAVMVGAAADGRSGPTAEVQGGRLQSDFMPAN